ncbi:MAG: HTTM domain-containing protein [Flavobacteriales bacterium]|nr:HTTM domain-containing protein [Flavobacteriales bacterium]
MLKLWLDQIAGPVLKPATMWLLERLVALWFLVMGLVYLPVKEIFWGSESLFAVAKVGQGIISNLFYVLSYNRWLDDYVFVTFVLSALWVLSGRWTTVAKALLYFTGFLLYYAAFYAFNSGLLTSLLLMFFLIFSSPASKRSSLQVLTNLAMMACMLQIVHIYAVAAANKWVGEDWLNGSAVYYAIQMEHYSPEWVRSFFVPKTLLLKILTWGGLIYQTVFPVLIWFKKVKKPLLIIGVLFHLGIGIMLSIYDFAFAMIFAYTVFLDESWSRLIISKLPRWWAPRSVIRSDA